MARALLLSILVGAAIVGPLSCGGKTAINGQNDGSTTPVTTGAGGSIDEGTGSGGSGGASTGSGGASVDAAGTGIAGATGAGGARVDAGTTGAGGTRMDAGTTGAAGATGAVDAGIMNCMTGAVCPTIGASCTMPCAGGMIRVCFCDPNGRVGCQACQPPPPPSCRATVTTGGACNPATAVPCTGCLNRETETCTCTRGMGGRATWNCAIPVPVQACQ